MSRRRTPTEEVIAFRKRCEELFAKEKRCPACAKTTRLAEGTMEPRICYQHQRIRREMAFPQSFRRFS